MININETKQKIYNNRYWSDKEKDELYRNALRSAIQDFVNKKGNYEKIPTESAEEILKILERYQ